MKLLKSALMAITMLSTVIGSTSSFAEETSKKQQMIMKLDTAATKINRYIEIRREKLEKAKAKLESGRMLDGNQTLFVNNLSSKLGVAPSEIETMLELTDVIPNSLFISIAAVNSNWGNENLFKRTNNPFGLRCYSSECGVADQKADKQPQSSELRVFRDLEEATFAFALELNTADKYRPFRDKRSELRKKGEYITAMPLAESISAVSDKTNFASDIRRLIHTEKLYYLDE